MATNLHPCGRLLLGGVLACSSLFPSSPCSAVAAAHQRVGFDAGRVFQAEALGIELGAAHHPLQGRIKAALFRYFPDRLRYLLRSPALFLAHDQITPEMADVVGQKAAHLQGFSSYLRRAGVNVSVPEWVVFPHAALRTILRQENFIALHRRDFSQALERVGSGSQLRFGDANHPLLVSVRASGVRVRPGRFITELNVGINDQTVRGLERSLNSVVLAWELYAKLIRELGLADGRLTRESFMDEATLRRATSPQPQEPVHEWRVRAYKALYEKEIHTPFPQDVYDQLALSIQAAAWKKRASAHQPDGGEVQSVIIQRMRFGVLPGSFAGAISSRNPTTGENTPTGTASKEAQGDDALEAQGLKALEEAHPEAYRQLLRMTQLTEDYFRDLGIIEFTVERDPQSGVVTPYLLQARQAEASKEARVKALYDQHQQGVLSDDGYAARIRVMNLEDLRWEPNPQVPPDAEWVAAGQLVSPGAVSGVAVMTLDQAQRAARHELPAILIKPVITAMDEPSVEVVQGLIAVEDFGWHGPSLSLRHGIPAVVGISQALFDPISERMLVGGPGGSRAIIPEQTLLMIAPDGKIYVRHIALNELINERGKTRKTYLDEPLVHALKVQLQSLGREADYVVDHLGEGGQWNAVLRRQVGHGEYERLKRLVRYDQRRVLVGVHDVVAAAAVPAAPKPVKPERVLPERIVERLAASVAARQNQLDAFTFFFWSTYDNLAQFAAQEEGLPVTEELPFVYRDLAVMQQKFVRAVAVRARPSLVACVFHGVDRHKMAQYIFRGYVLNALEKDFARGFFVDVLRYGAEQGYSGDDRAMDYQVARLYATFAKADTAFAKDLLGRLSPRERTFLIEELEGFYLVRNLRTKTMDDDFATYDQLLDVLDDASFTPDVRQATSVLRNGLHDRRAAVAQAQGARHEHRLGDGYVARLLRASFLAMDPLQGFSGYQGLRMAYERLQYSARRGIVTGWLDALGHHMDEYVIADVAQMIWVSWSKKSLTHREDALADIRHMLREDVEIHELATQLLLHGNLEVQEGKIVPNRTLPMRIRERLLIAARSYEWPEELTSDPEKFYAHLVHLIAQFVDDHERDNRYDGRLMDLDPDFRHIARTLFEALPDYHPVKRLFDINLRGVQYRIGYLRRLNDANLELSRPKPRRRALTQAT